MLEIRYYVAANGHQPFAEWFADLDPVARAKVVRQLCEAQEAVGNILFRIGAELVCLRGVGLLCRSQQ